MESSNIRTLTDIILPNLEDTGVFSLESPPLMEWWSIWEEGVWWPAREPARPPCTPAIVGSPWVILYSSIIRFHFGFSTTWNNVIEISALSLFLCRSGKLKDNGKRERERKKVSFQILALPFKRGIACAVRLERTASKLQCTKIQLLASGIVTAKKGIDITFCIQLGFFGGQKKKTFGTWCIQFGFGSRFNWNLQKWHVNPTTKPKCKDWISKLQRQEISCY